MEKNKSQRAYNIGLLQGKAYRTLQVQLTHALLPYDLSIPEWKLLGQLYDHGSIRLAGLANCLSVEAPLITALIDVLEKKKLVTRDTDASDKRAKVIKGTKRAMDMMPEIDTVVRRVLRTLFRNVTTEDVVAYIGVLEAIVKNGEMQYLS